MTANYAERYKDAFPYTNIENFVPEFVSSGINHIEGSIIGDESLFDDMRFVDTWPERFRYTDQKQSGPISALSLNAGLFVGILQKSRMVLTLRQINQRNTR